MYIDYRLEKRGTMIYKCLYVARCGLQNEYAPVLFEVIESIVYGVQATDNFPYLY